MASVHRLVNLVVETFSPRVIVFVDRVMPIAPPILDTNMVLALEQGKARPSAHELHIKSIDYTRPT